MRSRLLLTFLCFLFQLCIYAQDKVANLQLDGRVQDNITHTDLIGAKVDILTEDSTVMASTIADLGNIGYRKLAGFTLNLRISKRKYILKVSLTGYDTYCTDVNIGNTESKDINIDLSIIYLSKTREVKLDEVTVVATKIKFYNKGDTLVYNADAFQLAEGSMLDNLVAQLPGAQLKSDGRIYVNGKFVNELLLNGKDFFRGDNSVMLQNLPTYMIDKIKVYDKAGDLSIISGREMGDEKFVMDVTLKKKYNIGLYGNIDAGAGSDERYLARLFAMRMTDHSRISLYANQNNVNDHAKPGQSTDWSPDRMPLGRLTSRIAGVDVNVWGRDDKFNIKSTTQYQDFCNNIERKINTENFLTESNTYERILQHDKVKNWTISTQNDFNLKTGKHFADYLTINQNFSYQRSTPSSSSISSASLSSFAGYDQSLLDSIYNPHLTPKVTRDIINRNILSYLQQSDLWKGELNVSYMARLRNKDMMQVMANSKFSSTSKDLFTRQTIDTWDGTKEQTFLNRYSSLPEHSYNYIVGARYYQFCIPRLELRYFYSYEQAYIKTTKSIYRLEELGGWDDSNKDNFGMLPSEALYTTTIDINNSYSSNQLTRIHTVNWDAKWNFHKTELGKWQWNTQLSLQRTDRDYKFHQDKSTRLYLHWTLFSTDSEILYTSNDRNTSAQLIYNVSNILPNMLYLVDYKNDNNPLNITYGNSNLRYSTTHNWTARYETKRNGMVLSPSAYFTINGNAIGMAMKYDRSTGRREYHPENVDGNWKTGIAFSSTLPMGKARRWYLTNTIKEDFVNNVDLVGISTEDNFNKNIVKTSYLSDNLRIDYKFNNYSLSFKGNITWTNAKGGSQLPVNINAYDYNYGLVASAKLPWKFNVTSDMTVYTRSGYDFSAINSTDFIWNIRLSRPIFKGKIVLMADAFDVLGNLKNTTYNVNAQGKTETFNNTVRRYVLFHAIFKFDKQSTKKK